MTSVELSNRIIALIDELIPHTAAEDVTAAVSVLMATASALRGGRKLLIPLAGETWKNLDRLRADEAIAVHPRERDSKAFDSPPMTDETAERFLRVWSRAVMNADPRSRQFTDLWFRLLLLKAETDELVVHACEIAARSRRLRNLDQ
jgi:hypothetical protein